MSKFLIPSDRIPKPFNQDIVAENRKLITSVGSCAACTLTKILEVLNYIKTGEYTYLSKGYMYGRNNYPGKKNPGMQVQYTLDILLKRGSVPANLCVEYAEVPDIINKIKNRPDLDELDKIAEDYKIKSWENIGKQNLFKNVKKYLEEKQIPLAVKIASWKGEPHSVVAVGYEDDYILWQDHDGTDEIHRLPYKRFTEAYYLEGEANMKKFDDVEDSRWSKKYIEKVYEEGLMKGVTENSFAPSEPVTREQLAAVLCRALYGME